MSRPTTETSTLVYSVECDSHPQETVRLEVWQTGLICELWFLHDATSLKLGETHRDQWGVWVQMFGGNVAQEDGTRSFLDAMIKALQFLKNINELDTVEATVLHEWKPSGTGRGCRRV